MQKLCLFLLLTSLSLFAQSQLRLGIMGGPHSASVKESNDLPDWETQIKPGYSSRSGLHAGIMVEVPLSSSPESRWFFHPGLLYMAKGRKFQKFNDSDVSEQTDTISTVHNLSVNYMEVPLNLTYKIPISKKAKFLLSAGPYIGFFYSGKQKFETRTYSDNLFKSEDIHLETGNGEGKYKTIDMGLNARAGFELGNVLITGFFSQGLSNFYTASYTGTFKHQVKGLSIGFWLNKAKQPKKEVSKVVEKPVEYTPAPEPDTDGDGITDKADACPDKAGVPEFHGCPVPDSDGDGLNDLEDKCPTLAGPKENQGCPVIRQDTVHKKVVEKLNLAAQRIFFNTGSEQLTAASIAPLDEIVLLLKTYPSYRMTIEGHTDGSGKPDINKKLSQKRAESVKNYLIKSGIEVSRVQAIGFGAEKPIASNSTPEGKATNRRVEFKVKQ